MEQIITKSPEQTKKWAQKYIKGLKNAVILLDGDMGAGKTVIVKGFAKKLKVNEHVTSPTFTLINEYYGISGLYHFDLYRIETEDELFNIGFEEYLEKPGIKVFEWADKFNVFPENSLKIFIEIVNLTTRKISFTPKDKLLK